MAAHLLYYLPERRTPQIDVIEDVVPLYDVRVSIRPGFEPRRVYEAPSGQALAATWSNNAAGVVLALLEGHAMIVCEP